MINSRKLSDLLPIVAAKADNFIVACKAQGIDVLIYSTYRDHESQTAIYALGRTVVGSNPTPRRPMGAIVTNARAGESWHNYRCAFDWCPVINGKPAWDDAALYARCGVIAESVGLSWAGRWEGKFKEMAHCQYTGGLSLADLKNGKQVQ